MSLQVIDPVCHQLFDFYRSVNADLQRFTLELVPALLWTYVSSLYSSDKKVALAISLLFLLAHSILC